MKHFAPDEISKAISLGKHYVFDEENQSQNYDKLKEVNLVGGKLV